MFPLPNKINKLKKLVVDLSHNSDISCNYKKKQQLAIKKNNKLAILKNKSELWYVNLECCLAILSLYLNSDFQNCEGENILMNFYFL